MQKADVSRALAERSFLTYGGVETFLLFLQQFPLREFCAFEIASDEPAWQRMERELVRPILDSAAERGMGVLADTLVWRASADYVDRLGHGARGVAGVNRDAVARMRRTLDDWRATSERAAATPVLISGDMGPRGDGYAVGGSSPTAQEARDYHAPQVEALAAAGVDLVVALTMTSVGEAVGIAQAATAAGLPIVVSPTIEPDGRLPDGTPMGDMIDAVEQATSGVPVGYMANCVHPAHITATLEAAAERGAAWLARFCGLRANASTKTHAELDNSTELDRGDIGDLARRMAELQRAYKLSILGGCCGSDAEHLAAIARACR